MFPAMQSARRESDGGHRARRPSVGWMRLRIAFVLGLAACGGSAGAVVGADAGGGGRDGAAGDDGSAPDGTVVGDGAGGNDASEDRAESACVGFGCGLPDAGVDATATDSTAPFVDAGCVDGGLPPGMGSPFACGMSTCFSQSEYCEWSIGGLQQATREPHVGYFGFGQCMPLPCSCGAVPTCDCLEAQLLPGPICFCTAEGGALGVQCNLP
jgi:hypothetical protein